MDALTYPLPTISVKPPAPPINGPGRPAFKRLTKSQLAALAVAVLRGEKTLRPTVWLVSKALGVSTPYIETAMKLSPEQLRQMDRGELTIPQVKPAPEAPKAPTTMADVVAWWLAASEAEHAAVIGSVGVATPWDAIAAHLG